MSCRTSDDIQNYEKVSKYRKTSSCLFWWDCRVEMHQNLLFINHDASSLGRRNDIPLINSHVQKYHRTRRRRVYRDICSLPTDELRILQAHNQAESSQSSPCPRASRSVAVERIPIFNIRNIGKGMDHLSSLVSSKCDWLSETLDYCEVQPIDCG